MNTKKQYKKINPNTDLWKLATFLYFKGSAYKQDMIAYATKLSNGVQPNASGLLKELKKREIVFEKQITIGYRSKKRTTTVYFLTEQGTIFLNSYFSDKTDINTFKKIVEQFNTKKHDTLLSLYNQNHIKTMFNCVGIQTDVMTKPSIKQLWCYLNNVSYIPNESYEYPTLSNDRMQQMLHTGIYYDKEEFRELYTSELKKGEVLRSIFRGIYISDTQCFVIYSNGKGNGNMIYLPSETEEHLLTTTLIQNKFASINNISALTMSDTNYFIYGTLTGRRYGINKSNLDEDILQAKRNIEKEELLEKCKKNNWDVEERLAKLHDKWEKSDTWQKRKKTGKNIIFGIDAQINNIDIDGNYKNLYCITFNKTGIRSLQYLVSNNADAHYNNITNIASRAGNIEINQQGDSFYPLNYFDRSMWIPCIYLPYFELHTLERIKEDDFTPVIITNPEMTTIIQHCTRKHHIFIDENKLEKQSQKEALIIDKNGYNKGKKIIDKYLKLQSLTISEQQYRQLPSKFEMKYNEFYNAVATGEIKPEQITPLLETSEYDLRNYGKRRSSKKNKTIAVNSKIYSALKHYADKNDTTILEAASNLLNDLLDSNKATDTAQAIYNYKEEF